MALYSSNETDNYFLSVFHSAGRLDSRAFGPFYKISGVNLRTRIKVLNKLNAITALLLIFIGVGLLFPNTFNVILNVLEIRDLSFGRTLIGFLSAILFLVPFIVSIPSLINDSTKLNHMPNASLMLDKALSMSYHLSWMLCFFGLSLDGMVIRKEISPQPGGVVLAIVLTSIMAFFQIFVLIQIASLDTKRS